MRTDVHPRIAIGTTNPTKTAGVKEAIALYPALKGADIVNVKTASGVADQPTSLKETITGAKNRGKAAYLALLPGTGRDGGQNKDGQEQCAFGIGIESGLMRVPEARTGYLDLCACAVYDGKGFAIGFSPALEYPPEAVRLIIKEGLDATQAFNRIGLTDNPKVGDAEDTYGVLTKGRVDRKAYTKLAVIMALVQVEFSERYLESEKKAERGRHQK